MARRLLETLKIPTLFSAPASYTVCPVERFFGAIKRLDFERQELLSEPFSDMRHLKRLSNKQQMLSKITNYLIRLEPMKVKHLFMQ